MDARAMVQIMAPLPPSRIKAFPVWSHTMLDLFGPIEIKGSVNLRTRRKTWGVIFTCLSSRAVWVYLAESYSTDHLLTVMKKHESRNGSPLLYYADLGSQIKGADKIMGEAIAGLDQRTLENFSASRYSKFKFGSPHFPQGQGAVERLIREVKKSLRVVTRGVTTFGEQDCLLSEASFEINKRPMQWNPAVGEDGFLCPNDILFGRSDREPPMYQMEHGTLTKRAVEKQKILEEFWQKWSTSYLQTLHQYQKWKHGDRNARENDVVLILDKEIRKGEFIPAIIHRVIEKDDNVVRRVELRYKVPQRDMSGEYKPGPYKFTERNVRTISLLIAAEDRSSIEPIHLKNVWRPEAESGIPQQEVGQLTQEMEDDSAVSMLDRDQEVPEHPNVEPNSHLTERELSSAAKDPAASSVRDPAVSSDKPAAGSSGLGKAAKKRTRAAKRSPDLSQSNKYILSSRRLRRPPKRLDL